MSEHLGERLDKLINNLGLNQGEFARKLECSPAFISEVIGGIKKPGTEFLAKLSKTFDVSLDWLVCGRIIDPVSGRIELKISFEAFQAIALRTELALAAAKGNNSAISMINSLVNNKPITNQSAEQEILKLVLKTRMEELRFMVDQYNCKNASESLDTISDRALEAALKRFNPSSEDKVFSIINR